MSNILEVDRLTIVFETYLGTLRALNEVTLAVPAGEVVGIIGESGCGKSTLAQAILGLVQSPGRTSGGSIRFGGEDLGTFSDSRWQAVRGTEIGLLVSNPRARLNPLLGVGIQIENVVRSMGQINKNEAREKALAILKRVGIPDPSRRYGALPHEFSGGMCQRVVIAMAIVNEPKLVVADEPTSGLDVTVQRQVLDLLTELVADSGASVLMMTRDPGVVAHYCQTALVMREGAIIETGSVAEFFRRPALSYSRQLLRKAVAAQTQDVVDVDVMRSG